jgi:hypothetical protein
VVLIGPICLLSKKLDSEIQNWTDADSRELSSRTNWRARLLFDARARTKRYIEALRQIYEETGKQPGQLSRQECAEIGDRTSLRALPKWLEKVIIEPTYFNSVVAFSLIVIAVAWITANAGYHDPSGLTGAHGGRTLTRRAYGSEARTR